VGNKGRGLLCDKPVYDLCPGHYREIPGELTYPILHSQKATNYKPIIQMIFPSTTSKNLKHSEEQSKKPHI